MEIVRYRDAHFEQLVSFLRESWAPNHAIYDKTLFDWQYGGVDGGEPCGVVVVDGERIRGFIGGIPYRFLVDSVILNGTGLTIWVIDDALKATGIGILLRRAMEEQFDVNYTIGLNKRVITIYEKDGYTYYDAMHRYVLPLNTEGYNMLTLAQTTGVEAWEKSIPHMSPREPITNAPIDTLEHLYSEHVAPYFRLAPVKDTDFWQWRYAQSKGFSYLFFADEGGAVLARVDMVHAPGDSVRHGMRCLRIIEILPSNGAVWQRDEDQRLHRTVLGVLAWARNSGCVLADFQISCNRMDVFLNRCGFRKQGECTLADTARLFAPLRFDASPLNFAYRINGVRGGICRDDVYLVKSDCDMDRPNWVAP